MNWSKVKVAVAVTLAFASIFSVKSQAMEKISASEVGFPNVNCSNEIVENLKTYGSATCTIDNQKCYILTEVEYNKFKNYIERGKFCARRNSVLSQIKKLADAQKEKLMNMNQYMNQYIIQFCAAYKKIYEKKFECVLDENNQPVNREAADLFVNFFKDENFGSRLKFEVVSNNFYLLGMPGNPKLKYALVLNGSCWDNKFEGACVYFGEHNYSGNGHFSDGKKIIIRILPDDTTIESKKK